MTTAPAGDGAAENVLTGNGADWTPVPVLMYHAVENAPRPDKYKHFYVTAKEFAYQIRRLRERGYQAITLDTLADAQRGAATLPKKPLVLTFDDGYANLYENVRPLLREAKWPYAVYLVSERIGGRNEWVISEGFEPTPLLTWEQIREMQTDDNVSFEAHSATHPRLADLPLAAAQREMSDCRDRLEQGLQSPVRHFCYPYGSHNDILASAAADLGFRTATTTDFGRVRRQDDPLRLPRVSIYHIPFLSLTYGIAPLNFWWRVESRTDRRQ